MDDVIVSAYAKVNLALDVLGPRGDGYHDLRMVMQTVSLCDTLTLRLSRGGRENRLTVHTPGAATANLPADGRNLALAAANLFLERAGRSDISVEIFLEKRIPVCAGLGGGSADAAAVLRGLRDALEPDLPDDVLRAWALELGSDVPYCVAGGTRLAEGRGEILTPLPPLPDCYIVICKPDVSVSTREAFASLPLDAEKPDIPALIACLEQGDLRGAAKTMRNVFEPSAAARHGPLSDIRAELTRHGALGAVMSGTGPSMLAMYEKKARAEAAEAVLGTIFRETYLCEPKNDTCNNN